MKNEKKDLLIKTAKDTMWWPAGIIMLILIKLIFDSPTWESVYVLLLATPLIFLSQYRVNKNNISPKRQLIEWLIVVGVLVIFGFIVYLILQ